MTSNTHQSYQPYTVFAYVFPFLVIQYTRISPKTITSCLILSLSTFCCQNSSDPVRQGLHKTSAVVLWYLAPQNRSFISWKSRCTVQSQWIWLVCLNSSPSDTGFDWGLGNLEAKSTAWVCCCFPKTIAGPFLWSVCIFLLKGATCYN